MSRLGRRADAGRYFVAMRDAAHHRRRADAEAKLPYIVVLTNPTTGGVTASTALAMCGDLEPGALIALPVRA
jgi:acetyl-CoA carboxylase carboxyl transferase subunit beta